LRWTGSFDGVRALSSEILWLHMGQDSPIATNLINSERVAIKRQIGQRVKSAFTICSPYYPNGKVLLTSRYEKIINCIQSIACLFWLSIAQNVIFTTPMPNCSWIFNSSPLNRLPCADISMFRSNNDYL